MRQLKNVSVRGVALVKRPANRKPIHCFKSEGDSVPTDNSADAQTTSADSEILKSAAPQNVLDAISGIELTKGNNQAARDTLMGIAHLLHNSPDVSMQDLLAAGEAAGLAAVEKAKKDEEDEDEEWDDEEDEDGESKDKLDKLPPALRAKAREKMKKSAGESQAKGTEMPADVEKSEQVTITKAEHSMLVERLEKAEKEWRKHERQTILKAIKEENQAALPSLACDHDKLAAIVKSMSDANKEHGKELVAMLKGFEAQVAAANAEGGSIYQARARKSAAAASQGYQRFQELVKAEQEKSGCSQSEATLRVAKSEEGSLSYNQHMGTN